MRIIYPEFEHKDHRRKLTQLFTADIKQINSYDIKKGSILGNHYHKETHEYFYITKGTVLLNNHNIFNKGALFVIEPMEKHTIDCLTDVGLITFLTKPYTKENTDTYV